MLRSAEVLHLAENAEKFGVHVTEAHATLPEIVSAKDPIIQMLPVQKLGEMIHAFPTMAEAVSFVTEKLLTKLDKNLPILTQQES